MFPSVNIEVVKTTLASAMSQLGIDASFSLYDADSAALPVVVKVGVGSLNPEDITDGVYQRGVKLRIPSDAWDAASPARPPRKGDQATISGRRYGVQDVHERYLGGSLVMYVCTALG